MRSDLNRYLKKKIFPQLAPPPYGEIEAKKISPDDHVFRFCSQKKRIDVIGKFFKRGSVSLERAWRIAEIEYFNLNFLREQIGMDSDNYQVVAPLGKSRELSALLVTENVHGENLDCYIAKTIYENQSELLFDRLSDLARFFVKLHRSSESDKQVSLDMPRSYLQHLLDRLSRGPLCTFQREVIEQCASSWWERNDLLQDKEVIIHGDATPTNFIFKDRKVVGIDAEKTKWADRCWDLGFIAAELKHHFIWRMGSGWAAEAFIGHFLWEYAVHYDDTSLFYRITRKLPLYMALGFMRIARNRWLDELYKERLVNEAVECLK